MIDDQGLTEYLDQWMEDYGRPMHRTALECLVSGVVEYTEGKRLTLAEWEALPRDASNRVVHESDWRAAERREGRTYPEGE